MSHASVASRPGTQASGKLPQLPMIQHPMAGMAPGPAQIDVVAGGITSRASGRPLAAEQDYKIPKRLSTAGSRAESRAMGSRQQFNPSPRYSAIPEGVQTTQGDPEATRIPIFGNKSQLDERQDAMSRASTRLSKASTESRLELDELESIIKQRCRVHYNEVQKRFKDNDPQGQGNATKEGLLRIITTITGKHVSQPLFQRLMQRIGFQDKVVIHFSDFFTKFREVPNSGYPKWMTSINSNYDHRPTMNAVQVHTILKEKARQKVLDVADIVPQSNPEGAKRLLKPEFRNALNKMMFAMDDDEFEKLWSRYDEENIGVIDGQKLMKKLGINVAASYKPPQSACSPPPLSSRSVQKPESPMLETPKGGMKRKETERQRSLDIERWLKNKFREGFHNMKGEFEEKDEEKTGLIPSDDFCSILCSHGLKLERSHLDGFLARCGLTQMKQGVPYKEFLHRFQDRSEEGMPHKILGDPNHRYNKSLRNGSAGVRSTMSAIESQLMNMFQKDFLSLIGTFHKIDRLGQDIISQEEFRAAIESRFNIEMSDDQFRNLIDHVPITNEGDVKYAEFMAQFDTRGETKSLFSVAGPRGAPVRQSAGGVDMLDLEDEGHEKRSAEQLTTIIRSLLHHQYKDVERYFCETEEYNSQRLSQDNLCQLLKKFNIKPVITRGEIRDLWRTFLTNKDGKLEWLQFIRHFGAPVQNASYPNAKLNPPKRGDADYLVKSRKLNSDNDLLQDNLRQKIDYLWEDLKKEFFNMDPYGTGFVSCDEFRDVLGELCIHLTEYELSILVDKFRTKDGRVSYVEFLRPFAMKREVWRSGNNMHDLLSQPRGELPIAEVCEPPQKGLIGITAKLRQKLSGDWKNLRRAFKKMDKTGKGYLSLPEFRTVLKLANVVMTEDEVYQIMTKFDEDLSGKIAYNKFLSETFRPETRESQKK